MSEAPTLLYIRVSTQDQIGGNESQTRALLDWCEKQGIFNYEIFNDIGISGAKEDRPELNRLMARVEAGDVAQVVVFSFSRFARSVSHLLKALQKFKDKSVRFYSITEALDTNSPMGMALFIILGALAQLERELIRERVIAGLKNARAKGKRIGRVRKRNDVLIQSLLEAGMSFRTIATISKCSHGSVSATKKSGSPKKLHSNNKKSVAKLKIFRQPRPTQISSSKMRQLRRCSEFHRISIHPLRDRRALILSAGLLRGPASIFKIPDFSLSSGLPRQVHTLWMRRGQPFFCLEGSLSFVDRRATEPKIWPQSNRQSSEH